MLIIQDIIPSPIPNIVNPNAHLLFGLVMILLGQCLPLPYLSSGNRISSTLVSTRDHLFLLLGTAAIQSFALPPALSLVDGLFILPAVISSIFMFSTNTTRKDNSAWTMPSTTASGYWSALSLLPPTWRPHLQTILRTPTSSKIFYFLLLNLAYMGVQMVYGVWTNSLGLISDGECHVLLLNVCADKVAIHMLFDCLGLGVGLWASVAATWKPDGRYTYGYARVETLSGFANGEYFAPSPQSFGSNI
jgi:zinc transporter 5/7